jgi:hypothetical protein
MNPSLAVEAVEHTSTPLYQSLIRDDGNAMSVSERMTVSHPITTISPAFYHPFLTGYEDIDYPRHGHGISRDIKPEMRNCIIEYVAPSEYMVHLCLNLFIQMIEWFLKVRPPQPCVFMFVLDVSNTALETGYLPLFCKCLCKQLDNLPGDSRMMIGLMTFNSSLHYYSLKAGLSQPQMMVISDLDDQFFPSPEGLLVNLKESREVAGQALCLSVFVGVVLLFSLWSRCWSSCRRYLIR